MQLVPISNHPEPVFIDPEDWCGVRLYKWHHNNGYISTKLSAYAPTIRLHRFVLCINELPNGYEIDHINGNTFDNRKSNLRVVTHADNCRNRSAVDRFTKLPRGVTIRNGRYRSRVMYNYQNHWLGTFDTIEEAVYARASFINTKEAGTCS
ncbi:HNH nuclease [uncultured Caudovirales phage]|uniref:HNH nuclease n=1 Tax=uncultured Caudovirales phage TaxID=2100421 RepID=A0A6J5NW88_9CAUD|nr:HNH nuclease [uncultured Caudovirales phage]